jgi:alkanesulfonate monooxygenase SsuD/methylene tetrahydromethanopterin reductase-like flavin-dependent oxidoreductase (luciferase family)
MALCEALALTTSRIPFGTAIANLYSATYPIRAEAALTTSSAGASISAWAFARAIEQGLGGAGRRRRCSLSRRRSKFAGELRRVVAALRQKMVALAGEIADGVVFANAARSHMRESLSALPAAKRNDAKFFIGDMIPICISDDRAAAMERIRKTLAMYVSLPNYRYWRKRATPRR